MPIPAGCHRPACSPSGYEESSGGAKVVDEFLEVDLDLNGVRATNVRVTLALSVAF